MVFLKVFFILLLYKISAFKDSYFYRNALVAASEKIWRTSYLTNYKLPCRFIKYFIPCVRFKNMNADDSRFRKSYSWSHEQYNYSLMVNVRPLAKIIFCILLPRLSRSSVWRECFHWTKHIFFHYVVFYEVTICYSKISIEQWISNAYYLLYSSVNVFNDNIVWWFIVFIGKITSTSIAYMNFFVLFLQTHKDEGDKPEWQPREHL